MDIVKGSQVLIRNRVGTPVRVAKVVRTTEREFTVMHGTRFLRRGGKEVGGDYFATPATQEDIDALRLKQAADSEERERKESARLQAEYDALPEEVKLARTICWICETRGEEEVCLAPITLLREMAAWCNTVFPDNHIWRSGDKT